MRYLRAGPTIVFLLFATFLIGCATTRNPPTPHSTHILRTLHAAINCYNATDDESDILTNALNRMPKAASTAIVSITICSEKDGHFDKGDAAHCHPDRRICILDHYCYNGIIWHEAAHALEHQLRGTKFSVEWILAAGDVYGKKIPELATFPTDGIITQYGSMNYQEDVAEFVRYTYEYLYTKNSLSPLLRVDGSDPRYLKKLVLLLQYGFLATDDAEKIQKLFATKLRKTATVMQRTPLAATKTPQLSIPLVNATPEETKFIYETLQPISTALKHAIPSITIWENNAMHHFNPGTEAHVHDDDQHMCILRSQLYQSTLWHEAGHAREFKLRKISPLAAGEWRTLAGDVYGISRYPDRNAFPMNGLLTQYGAKNYMEDLAEWVESVYGYCYSKDGLHLFVNLRHDPRHIKKLDFLLKYHFIEQKEYDHVKPLFK